LEKGVCQMLSPLLNNQSDCRKSCKRLKVRECFKPFDRMSSFFSFVVGWWLWMCVLLFILKFETQKRMKMLNCSLTSSFNVSWSNRNVVSKQQRIKIKHTISN
jgi:hypothetical protein